MKSRISLDGESLKPNDIFDIAYDPRAVISVPFESMKAVQKAFEYTQEFATSQITYGVNTGFGPMANRILGHDHVEELQYNLIRSHACSIGSTLPAEFSRAALAVRVNTIVKGYSGVSPELVKLMVAMLNANISPVVYEHGAVGTSGDLVQLAHIALSIIGEGNAWYGGEVVTTAKAFIAEHLHPHKLKAKEGLSLINGTAFMSGIASINVTLAQTYLELCILHAAVALEIVEAFDDGISKELHAVRNHEGQVKVAEKMRKLISGGKRLRKRHATLKEIRHGGEILKLPSAIQEIYSLRCSPQILGPVYEELARAVKTVQTEINSVTDNPIVYSGKGVFSSGHGFFHGGNFHGDYVSQAMDKLKASIIKATMLSERRTNFFLNDSVNKIFPPFLNVKTPGLTLALQALQFVATSTTAQSQSLGYPHHLHSISTNADNQDVVSMGTESSIFAYRVLQNAFVVQSVEAVSLAQAMDIVGGHETFSPAAQAYYRFIRKIFPRVYEDRSTADELNLLTQALQRYII